MGFMQNVEEFHTFTSLAFHRFGEKFISDRALQKTLLLKR